MSEDGWRAFLRADGLSDWVVLHGGATAVFRTDGLRTSAALAARIAEVEGLETVQPLVTISTQAVSVRLTRDLWNLEPVHIELARAVSAVASAAGAVADRGAISEVQVAIAAHSEQLHAPFWRAVLGYQECADDNAVDPLGHGSTVWMQELEDGKALRHAMHIDVSVARETVRERLAAAVAAGGRIVDAAEEPGHWTLADPAGNRVCLCAWPDGSTQPDLDSGP